MPGTFRRALAVLIDKLKQFGRRHLPVSTRRGLARLMCWPPVGWVRFGSLRRLSPISTVWGSDRGRPIDRYYIEQFLASHASDIRGRVLEIGDNRYTRQFGRDRVATSDVLHVAESRADVTIIGDLTNAGQIPDNTFDCIILTQTLQAIYDVASAIRTVGRILRPGGVVLVTIPGISRISQYEMARWGYYWSFTSASARRLFSAEFPSNSVQVSAHGNVLAAISFLHGLATHELSRPELDHTDPDFELLITVRATKPSAT
jgi:SAM-dependent methyltransferase